MKSCLATVTALPIPHCRDGNRQGRRSSAVGLLSVNLTFSLVLASAPGVSCRTIDANAAATLIMLGVPRSADQCVEAGDDS